MKFCLTLLICWGFISGCSSSIYNTVSKDGILTAKSFFKNEKLINNILKTPSSREVHYYSSPDSTLSYLGTIPPATEVRVLSRDGHWYKINYTDSMPLFVLVTAMHYQDISIYQRKALDITNPASISDNSGQIIQTGPRGGRYYINSNGNKTYVKHK